MAVRSKECNRLGIGDRGNIEYIWQYQEIHNYSKTPCLENLFVHFVFFVFVAIAFALGVWVTREYLSSKCTEQLSSNGKTFNNIRASLNSVFRATLLESGLSESPFQRILSRVVRSRHQRPFTEAEFQRIYHAAVEPWRTAVLISWFTGLREKDVFLLRWEQIVATLIPKELASTL